MAVTSQMRRAVIPLLSVVSLAAHGQTLTVCEALHRLDDLNGKEIKVRGVWQMGHTGRFIWSDVNCELPILRDGWVWKPFIQLWPRGEGRRFDDDYERLKGKKYSAAPPSKIVATITGHLETHSHFQVSNGRPADFKYAAAILWYSDVEQIEKSPYTPGELERALEAGRHPYPVRTNK
jgi:hypothetical protein